MLIFVVRLFSSYEPHLIYEMDIKIKSLSLSSLDFTSLRQLMNVDVWETIKYFILLVIELG